MTELAHQPPASSSTDRPPIVSGLEERELRESQHHGYGKRPGGSLASIPMAYLPALPSRSPIKSAQPSDGSNIERSALAADQGSPLD